MLWWLFFLQWHRKFLGIYRNLYMLSPQKPLREMCPNTDQKKLRIWKQFTQWTTHSNTHPNFRTQNIILGSRLKKSTSSPGSFVSFSFCRSANLNEIEVKQKNDDFIQTRLSQMIRNIESCKCMEAANIS